MSMYDEKGPSIPKAKLFKWGGYAALGLTGLMLVKGFFYYNEAGYQTHIRTIWGQEKVVDSLGWSVLGWGSKTSWPKEMTAQSIANPSDVRIKGDIDGYGSALISGFDIRFLGGVTAKVDSNVRIILPKGDQFLALAQAYRNPDNFLTQSLLPGVKDSLQSTAQMMTADEYYSGGKSEFSANFKDQLSDGVFLVNRREINQGHNKPSKTAILQAGTDQGEFGDANTTKFVTEKVLKDGVPVRLEEKFKKLGIIVAEATIIDVDPNKQFKDRMINGQQSQADLSLARLDRAKEEEQKRLVTARGEREVEEKRQSTLRDQIEKTTQAETQRQLALIDASREKEKAEIEKQTAQISYEKAVIEAKTTKELADAEAYQKKALITADGALQQKLKTLVEINKSWADAASKAPVPSIMMGSGSGSSAAGSRQADLNDYMQIIAAKSLKDLSLDLSVKQ